MFSIFFDEVIILSGSAKYQNNSELIISMAAVFFSSMIINIIIKKGISFDYLAFSVDDIKRSLSLPVVSSFFVLLLKRLKQVIIVIVLMKLIKPEIVYNLLIIILSVLYGTVMSIQAYYGGIYYAGIFIISILPHYIIYFLCIDLIFKFYKGRVFNKNKIRFISTEFMLTMIGVFLEENFLRIFLK
ncbi:MAG: hypothetical protein IJ224_10125 [Lachnospiraceae bacterium]|nr:hypothetical protein [Lachnospiraceae bacterium]